jgi:hypothetical protein
MQPFVETLRLRGGLQIFSLFSRNIILEDVETFDTIGDIKSKIQDKVGNSSN